MTTLPTREEIRQLGCVFCAAGHEPNEFNAHNGTPCINADALLARLRPAREALTGA